MHGYAMLPPVFRHDAAGELEAAAAVAAEAAAIGKRHGDPELMALAIHAQGHMLVLAGRVPEGLALLDEAMVAVTTARAVAVRRRHRLLRRHPRLPGGLRGRSGARVDARADPMGRATARPGRVHGSLPRPSRRDPAAGRVMVGGPRGGAARGRAFPGDEEPCGGSRALPSGRAPAAARRVRRRRAGVSRCEPEWLGASARPGATTARAREARGRARRDPKVMRRSHGAAQASGAAPCPRRDRARRRRGRRSADGVPRAARAREAVRERDAGRDRRARARCGRARGG